MQTTAYKQLDRTPEIGDQAMVHVPSGLHKGEVGTIEDVLTANDVIIRFGADTLLFLHGEYSIVEPA